MPCQSCSPCDSCDKPTRECKNSAFVWAVQDCEIRAKLNGEWVDPLPLCDLISATFPRVDFILDADKSVIRQTFTFPCDCKEPVSEEIYICDVLNLGRLSCLSDVSTKKPQPCDFLVYSPCNASPDDKNKWLPYQIPFVDANPPAVDGKFKVLVKNGCGCIEERPMPVPDDQVISYMLRDGLPDDPDFPFHVGSFAETINLDLQNKIPVDWRTKKLKVTLNYTFNVSMNNRAAIRHVGFYYFNGESAGGETVETASQEFLHNRCWHYDTVVDTVWRTASNPISVTFLVPAGKSAFLRNIVRILNGNQQVVANGGQAAHGAGGYNTRLHGLHVIVEAIK